MKLDIFNEVQEPRPWADDHEHLRITQAIEQAELADRSGYGCWWQVEHDGAEESSLFSAPEMLLAAISQRTSGIRRGRARAVPVQPPHPRGRTSGVARSPERRPRRAGLTRSTTPEWRLFGTDPADVRPQTAEAFTMIPRMWTSERFGYSGSAYQVDEVPIVPKPLY